MVSPIDLRSRLMSKTRKNREIVNHCNLQCENWYDYQVRLRARYTKKDLTGNIKRIHGYIDKSEIDKRLAVLEARVSVQPKITSSTSPIVFRCLHRKVPVPSSTRFRRRPLSGPAGLRPFYRIFRCQSRRGPVVWKVGGADYVRNVLKNN